MTARRAERDTDADWRELGESQPYWGVLTQPDYRTENLTAASLETFYATGAEYIEGVVEQLERLTGARPSGRGLDFGCGAGRLTEAMSAYCDAIGYDISPGMLAKARERGGKGTYVGEMPAGPFDWINTFIVLQHIPPARGMGLIEQLMERLAPGGHLSLQVTIWREPHLIPPSASGWRKLAKPLVDSLRGDRREAGAILMYDYDLSAVMARLNRAGVVETTLIHTDHGGHHGVIILGRRTGAAS